MTLDSIWLELLWIPVSFLCGALPFSVWIGRWAGYDITQYGDGNPGATNVLRAAGKWWFILAMCADFSKAAVPVGLATHVFGWTNWPVWFIAMAPPVGHMYSPFLGWKGGKALAAILGCWIGLTLWRVPLVMLISILATNVVFAVSGWAVLVAGLFVMAYLAFFMQAPLLITIFFGHFALALYAHRLDYRQPPRLRSSFLKRFQR